GVGAATNAGDAGCGWAGAWVMGSVLGWAVGLVGGWVVDCVFAWVGGVGNSVAASQWTLRSGATEVGGVWGGMPRSPHSKAACSASDTATARPQRRHPLNAVGATLANGGATWWCAIMTRARTKR
ncbi:MAG: hypothetical protein ACO3HB_07695, partial [Burkholderiaceae bacterium]